MAQLKKRISRKEDLENFDFKTMNPKANLRPELKEKIEKWIISFYHLDPRYKILTFFNLVAAEGADNVTDDQLDEQKSYAILGNGSINNSSKGSLGMIMGDDSERNEDSTSEMNSSSVSKRSPDRDNFSRNANIYQRPSARHIRPSTLSLLSSLFNATSILTVWRPCSNDAMRKMMEGTGVGKGLDIKGKSAKKGSLSAYVPFMQIFNNDHKDEIQPIAEYAEMRVYYSSIELRDHAYEFLQKYLKDGPSKKRLKKIDENKDDSFIRTSPDMIEEGDEEGNLNDEFSEEEEVDEGPDRLPPHKDPRSPLYLGSSPKLKRVKKFAKTGFYGIECSQRLFWYATVQDADISRVGTGTETGRPSLPGFQDANLKTLKVAQSQLPKPNPMPVVMQHKSMDEIQKDLDRKEAEAKEESDEDDDVHPLDGCLDPRHLVMAYEEQGTIKPVVSDFDGFLLGWRREALWFGCNLPRDQESLMMWCVDHIEEILDDQKKNPTNSDTWTVRWLEVMKRATAEGFVVDVPEYGFGDPKSTSIMEHAANKLKSTGAVRHGSECFNYHFPQEIDDMFLLISDTLKPVPWKYVNEKDLQAILSKKIAEGFVFPLNPKWILCDPGWKKIYDDLMASDALYADLSKDVWFPPHNGIRERIEEIFKRHPNGFQRGTPNKVKLSADKSIRSNLSGRRQSATNILRETLDEAASELTGNAFADLAQLELEDFKSRTSGNTANRKSPLRSDIDEAVASLTIEELEDEDHSSSEARTSSSTWRTPSKPYEKRPSAVSHSSMGSSQSDKYSAPQSGRSIGLDGKPVGSSSHSSSSTSAKPVRKLVRSAVQSTRKFLVPGQKKNRSRGSELNNMVIGEADHEEESPSVYRAQSNYRAQSYHSNVAFPPKATRQVSDPLPVQRSVDVSDKSAVRLTTVKKTKSSSGMKKAGHNKWTRIRASLKHQKSS